MKAHGIRASAEWLAQFKARGGSFEIQGNLPLPEKGKVVEARPPGIEKQKVESGLNKTETLFLRILIIEKYQTIGIQSITLRLADRVRYTPDFSTVNNLGRLILWEVKGGFIRDDAWQKLKIAARVYPYFDFVMAQYRKGEWTRTRISV